jgi:hypothetical protein
MEVLRMINFGDYLNEKAGFPPFVESHGVIKYVDSMSGTTYVSGISEGTDFFVFKGNKQDCDIEIYHNWMGERYNDYYTLKWKVKEEKPFSREVREWFEHWIETMYREWRLIVVVGEFLQKKAGYKALKNTYNQLF